MSNGAFCCAVGLCCDAASVSRRAALIEELSLGLSTAPSDLEPASAAAHDLAQTTALEHVADWLIANVDMAPKGTLNLEPVAEALKKQHGV